MADLAQGLDGTDKLATEALRRLLIHELFAAFAHRVDDGDLHGWSELFTNDAVLITSRGIHQIGRSAIRQMITASHQENVKGQGRHLIVNVEVHSMNADSAVTEADVVYVLIRPGGSDIQMVARYRSDLVWRSSGWKIARHQVEAQDPPAQ